MPDYIDFDRRLERAKSVITKLKHRRAIAAIMREHFYELMVERYDQEMKAIDDAIKLIEGDLKKEILEYVDQTGNTKPHDAVEFRRNRQLMYDADDALAWAIENGHDELVKKTLKKADFNKAVKGKKIAYPGAEDVPSPVIALYWDRVQSE
jgi:hypothetical protein